jgi:hypothetical protein
MSEYYDPNTTSSCCGAVLLCLEDGWGVCNECKEWAMNEEEYEDMAHKNFYQNEK